MDRSVIEIDNTIYYEATDKNENNYILFSDNRIIARIVNGLYCIVYSSRHLNAIRKWAGSFNIVYLIKSGTNEIL